MLKIDIHTHILPPEMPRLKEKFGYGGFIELKKIDSCHAKMMRDDGTFFRDIEHNCWSPQARLEDCEKSSTNVQVLSPVPVLFSYWAKAQDGLYLSKYLNDHIAGVVRDHPKKFVGLGTIPLQSPKLAVGEMERCVRQLGLVGVEIGSHVNEWNLSDPELFPVFEAAADMGAAVFVHPWDMMGQDRMKKYWLPWLVGMPAEMSLAICSVIFGGVLEKLPKLRIAFAHGGGAFPSTLGRISHAYQVRPDLCAKDNAHDPREYVGRIYLDSLVHDSAMLKYLLNLFGENRIALGTDYPFPLGELEPGKLIESMDLSESTTKRLLSGTALEWLGKKEKDFLGVAPDEV